MDEHGGGLVEVIRELRDINVEAGRLGCPSDHGKADERFESLLTRMVQGTRLASDRTIS